jgi:hypothetical protein
MSGGGGGFGQQVAFTLFFVPQSANSFYGTQIFITAFTRNLETCGKKRLRNPWRQFFIILLQEMGETHQVRWSKFFFMNLLSFHVGLCHVLHPTDRPWCDRSNYIHSKYIYVTSWRSVNSRIRKLFCHLFASYELKICLRTQTCQLSCRNNCMVHKLYAALLLY